MTSTEAEAGAAAAAGNAPPDRRRLYRAAGFGGVGVFVAWAAQPVIVSIMSPGAPENGRDFAYIESTPFLGVMEAIVFSGIGVAMLFMVTAVGQLTASAGPPSTAARVGHLLGVLSGIAWFFVAGSVARAVHLRRIPPRRGSARSRNSSRGSTSCMRSSSAVSSGRTCSASSDGLSCSLLPAVAPESSAGR